MNTPSQEELALELEKFEKPAKFHRPPASYPKGSLVCTTCGFVGKPRSYISGGIVTEIVLWLFFLLPGLIYSIWRVSTKYKGCPQCRGKVMIPVTSPMAAKFL